MHEVKSLWGVNPIIHEYKHKYIYGTDRNAVILLAFLTSENVYLDGFVDDKTEHDLLFHKRVYKLKEISKESTIILGENTDTNAQELGFNFVNPLVLRIDKEIKKAVIFGAGRVGCNLYKKIIKQIEIVAFIDTYSNQTRIKSIPVYKPNYIRSLDSDCAVIECGHCYKEIDKQVIENNLSVKRYKCEYSVENDFEIDIYINRGQYLNLYSVISLSENMSCHNKTLLLCGRTDKTDVVFKILNLLDFNCRVINQNELFDMVYYYNKDSYRIILTDDNYYEYEKILKDLGFKDGIDYRPLVDFDLNNVLTRKSVLDINMGYIYLDKNVPYHVYGKKDKAKFQIITIGGSTVDGGLYPFKSWPEFLYEMIDDVAVINMGMAGYTSSMELMLVIREIINMDPDMVISYGGSNDAVQNVDREPFGFEYMKSLLGTINRNKEQIYCGSKSVGDAFDDWIRNMSIINEICKLEGIHFLSFLQPMLCSKMNKTKAELCLLHQNIMIRSAESTNNQYEFRDSYKKRILGKYDYILDLSNIFDDVESIYMDLVHVYEKGNEIIAREICNVVNRRMFKESKSLSTNPR